jgi:hypothetical protein
MWTPEQISVFRRKIAASIFKSPLKMEAVYSS